VGQQNGNVHQFELTRKKNSGMVELSTHVDWFCSSEITRLQHIQRRVKEALISSSQTTDQQATVMDPPSVNH
jgi:hypothetical protein